MIRAKIEIVPHGMESAAEVMDPGGYCLAKK